MDVTALGQGSGNKRDGLVGCWLPPKSVLLPHTHVGTGGNGAAWGEGGRHCLKQVRGVAALVWRLDGEAAALLVVRCAGGVGYCMRKGTAYGPLYAGK